MASKKALIIISFFAFLSALPSFAAEEINLSITRPSGSPYYLGVPEINIDSEEFNTLVFKIKANQSGTARLFWASSYDPQMNEPKSLWFRINKSSNFKDYYFNLPSQNPNWMGWIKGFLIYPDIDPQLIEIKQAKLTTGNWLTNIKSAWQEFWGPKGRVVIGSSINVTPSSSIFGRSVNIYVYWILGIFFVFLLSAKFFLKVRLAKEKDYFKMLNASFREAIPQTLILTLSFWFLLALNTDYNFFNIFKENFTKYWGKSLEEKRAIAYGKDFYNFLVFAQEKLPPEAVRFGLLTSFIAINNYARIYLFPHIYTNQPGKEFSYLLIYYPSAEQKIEKEKYLPFAKLNENAYILKKIK